MNYRSLKRALDGLLAILYPCFCKICGAFVSETRQASICWDCWDSIHRIEDPVCTVCGLPLPSLFLEAPAPPRCGACIFDTYPFTGARAAARYDETLREVIHLFKFGQRKNLAERLADLLYQAYLKHQAALPVDIIVAVPLHPDRLRERGFNQSELLAERLGQRARLACAWGALARVRATAPQSGLNKKSRASNVRRAFAVPSPERVRGKAVLLVDDVFTTGATLSECARTLQAAGARAVYVLTVARVSEG